MEAKRTLGEPRLLISRSALLHNVRVLRQRLDPAVKLCAMIKADAYGHGATVVTDALTNLRVLTADIDWDGEHRPGARSGASAGPDAVSGETASPASPGSPPRRFPEIPPHRPAVDQLAVATIDEAAALPEADLPVTVMRQIENVFIGRQREVIDLAVRNAWTLTIATPSAADDLARIAQAAGRRCAVHVMVDTGMTRCGTAPDRLPALLEKIASLPPLRLVSIGTHFANAEVAHHPYTKEQLRTFATATEKLATVIRYGAVLRHAANSGGIFFTPRAHLDMVRPGISLYGIDPTGRPNVERPLKPVMKWTAPITAIHHVKAGTTVGYNQTFVAPRDMRVGLIPVGYADGYLRSLSNRGVMVVNGEACPVVGRISMDLTTIDLTRAPSAMLGDTAVIVDDDPLSPASAYEIARLADTIPYELFTRIGSRVRRVPVDPEDSQIASAEPADEV